MDIRSKIGNMHLWNAKSLAPVRTKNNQKVSRQNIINWIQAFEAISWSRGPRIPDPWILKPIYSGVIWYGMIVMITYASRMTIKLNPPMFPLSSGWSSLISPHIISTNVDRSNYSLFNMVQIKFSIVFILAAAAIVPAAPPPARPPARQTLPPPGTPLFPLQSKPPPDSLLLQVPTQWVCQWSFLSLSLIYRTRYCSTLHLH